MKSTPEQRLFGRIVALTFLLGLVSGLLVVFTGMSIYKFGQSGFDPLMPSSLGWPLDALQIIVGSAFTVLLVTVADWYAQFFRGREWKNNYHVIVRFCSRFVKILGFFLMGEGVVSLLDKPLSILYPRQKLGIYLFLALLVPLCIVILSWYAFVRGKRRVRQQATEKEAAQDATM